ncbi:hypothetical protein [Streptomyces phaeochromogenes]|uniref:hypothetical protein n=1 Tax=Streptomyces phaeochromogenes TaxID=1923 RepID=UPI002E0EBF24|nr:hypothetical protein OG437_41135 [Streptomyces phaeochromogenes]
MTARRGRGSAARRRRQAWLKSAGIGGGVLLVLLAMFWSAVWPYVTAALLLGGIGAIGWWLWPRTGSCVHGTIAGDRTRR